MKGLASKATPVALILSLLAAGYLIVAPTYEGMTTASSVDGVPTVTETRTTLIQENGWSALILVLIPVLICITTLFLNRRRLARSVAAIMMVTFVFVGGMSIGMLYAPSAAVMIVAALARS